MAMTSKFSLADIDEALKQGLISPDDADMMRAMVPDSGEAVPPGKLGNPLAEGEELTEAPRTEEVVPAPGLEEPGEVEDMNTLRNEAMRLLADPNVDPQTKRAIMDQLEAMQRMEMEAGMPDQGMMGPEMGMPPEMMPGEAMPPGMDPGMMGGGMPPGMDPGMMGGGMPPGMDPGMMGGAPAMPPAMMGGAPAMPPGMGGGVPPAPPGPPVGAPNPYMNPF